MKNIVWTQQHLDLVSNAEIVRIVQRMDSNCGLHFLLVNDLCRDQYSFSNKAGSEAVAGFVIQVERCVPLFKVPVLHNANLIG